MMENVTSAQMCSSACHTARLDRSLSLAWGYPPPSVSVCFQNVALLTLDLSFAWSKTQLSGLPLAAGFRVLRSHHVLLWLLGFWTPLGDVQRWLIVLTASKGVKVFLERSHALRTPFCSPEGALGDAFSGCGS